MFQPPVSRPTPPLPPEDGPLADADPLPPEAYRAIAALTGGGGGGRVVAHQPCFARVFGGAACGLLLSQFWFWTGTPCVRERNGGWFWKSQREITEETGLSRSETETARRSLCAAGVLEEQRRGLPATMHFRLDMNVVMRAVWRHLQAQERANKCAETARAGARGMRTLVRGARADKFAGIAQTTSERTSETIPEKTQETTQTRARPVLPPALGEGKEEGRGVEGRCGDRRGAGRGEPERGGAAAGGDRSRAGRGPGGAGPARALDAGGAR